MRFSNCYCFLLHGYTGMFDYWFKNGMKEPPKEMGPYVSEFRHDLIKNYYQIRDKRYNGTTK